MMIHHGKNAAIVGINHNDGAIHISQSRDGGLTHNRIFSGGNISRGLVLGVGAGRESLIVAMAVMPAVVGIRGAANCRRRVHAAAVGRLVMHGVRGAKVTRLFVNIHTRSVNGCGQRDWRCAGGHERSQQGQKENPGEEETQLHLDCTFVMLWRLHNRRNGQIQANFFCRVSR